jgi:hypothetical protein
VILNIAAYAIRTVDQVVIEGWGVNRQLGLFAGLDQYCRVHYLDQR